MLGINVSLDPKAKIQKLKLEQVFDYDKN